MIKLLTIVGARPQFIKAAAVSRAISTLFSNQVQEKILHTGQHYDEAMSSVFFTELRIPKPEYNLGVGSASQGAQTGRMLEGIEKVLLNEHFDGVVIYGDTNSTLAGALAASKLHIPVFHIEAGLRSFNMLMPEEINRIVSDQVSSVLFAPTKNAVRNLLKEGFGDKKAAKLTGGCARKVVFSGDVMYDNSLYYAQLADKNSNILDMLALERNSYILATVHRDFNTDSAERLRAIFKAFVKIADESKLKIVMPLHPRTKHKMDDCIDSMLKEKLCNGSIVLTEPVSFFNMVSLEKNSALVMTDSGGVQKEAFFYEKPCVILRPETEWSEIVEHGAGILADADSDNIVKAFEDLYGRDVSFPELFGNGHASEKIVDNIVGFLTV